MRRFAGLVGENHNGTRRALDFYPTPPECTVALMRFLNWEPKTMLECACGNGAISEVLIAFGHSVTSQDIFNHGYGTPGIDFLKYKHLGTPFDAIITNPPFNKSEAFIRHALLLTPYVAMLLKSQYWHSRTRHKLFVTRPPAWILPLTWRPDFTRRGSSMMDMAWSVWLPDTTATLYKPLLKPILSHELKLI